jgi:hypothetical protein
VFVERSAAVFVERLAAVFVERLAAVDVAVPGLGVGRRDPDRHEVAGPGALDGDPHRLREAVGVQDDVVGRERAHDRARIPPLDQRRGQTDRAARVPRRRLGHDLLDRQLRQLPGHRCRVAGSGHDHEPVRFGQRGQPVVG